MSTTQDELRPFLQSGGHGRTYCDDPRLDVRTKQPRTSSRSRLAGAWCDYHISLTWRDDLEALHLDLRLRLQGHQAQAQRGLSAPRAHQRAALARPFRPLEGGRDAALPPRLAAGGGSRPMPVSARHCSGRRWRRASAITRPFNSCCGPARRLKRLSPPSCSKRKATHDAPPRRPAPPRGSREDGRGAPCRLACPPGLDPALAFVQDPKPPPDMAALSGAPWHCRERAAHASARAGRKSCLP